MKILVVDDDQDLLSLVGFALTQSGFVVVRAADVPTALRVFAAEAPDLAILDINLPGGSGFDICEAIRRQSRIPVMMLTARGEEEDLVRALDLGADDYITKPLVMEALMARIRALLRRSGSIASKGTLAYRDLVMDQDAHRVSRNTRALHLGPTEYRLLEFFLQHPGRVFTREQLLDGVWGRDIHVEPRTVDVHIRRLRKAVNGPGEEDLIRTVRSAGYALDAEAT